MLRRFDQRVALVTGAAGGIGRAVAQRLALEGATVVVAYRSGREHAHALVAELSGSGATALALEADLTDDAAARDLAVRALARFGRVDALINNAGAAAFAPLLDLSAHILDEMMDVNVKSALRMIQAFAPSMVEARRGRIVNVASVAALGTSVPGTTPYAIAKAALVQLTKRAALELGSAGITVNAVCPGATRTRMLEQATSAEPGFADARDSPRVRTMLGRIADPSEIASAIAFLASDDASYVTGQALTVDGGLLNFLSRSA